MPTSTAEDTEMSPATDPPNPMTNTHIAEISAPPGSPSPKTNRKPKSGSGKKGTLTTAPTSILKGSALKTKARLPPHDHTYKRIIIEASVVLDQPSEKDRFSEFNHALGIILKNGAYLDEHFELNPIHPSSSQDSWKLPKDVPSNMTILGQFISINTPLWRFKRKGPKASDNTIYFSFTISTDCTPADLCGDMIMEWNRQGGDRLAVKAVQSHNTIQPVMFFRLWNDAPIDGLLSELKEILTQAWRYGRHKGYSDLPPLLVLPDMTLIKKLPQLKGENTHKYVASLPPHVQNARKVLHLEVGRSHADLIKRLTTIAKETQIFEAWWGSTVHPSIALDPDAPKKQRDALASMAQDHTAFMIGTRCERLVGITRLDKRIDVIQEVDGTPKNTGNVSLRTILLDHLTLSNGGTLICSIHQHNDEDPLVIIPNEAETESMIMRLNHQLPAFLLHYLPTKTNIPREFVLTLLKKTCDPALFNDAHRCTWDEKDMVITRPDEAELAARKEREDKASQWYRGLLNIHLVSSNQPTNPTEHVTPEARYDFDGEKSVTTIHPTAKPKKRKSNQAQQDSAESSEDSDFEGDDDISDSASVNANTKPYSSVGFGKSSDLDGYRSDSSMEDASIGSANDRQATTSQGKGG